MPAALAKLAPSALLKCPIHHQDCPSQHQVSSSSSYCTNGENELELCHPSSCPMFLVAIIVITFTVNQAARWILLRGRGAPPVIDSVELGQSVGLEQGFLTQGIADHDDQTSSKRKKAAQVPSRYLKKSLKFSCCPLRLSRTKKPASARADSISLGSADIPSRTADGGAFAQSQLIADTASAPGFSANPPRAILGSVVRMDGRPGLGHPKQVSRTLCGRIIRRLCCCFQRSRITRRARGFHGPRVVRELREVEVVKGRVRRVAGANDVTIIPFERGGETGEVQERFLRQGILGVSRSARNLMGTGARGNDVVVDEKWDAAIELTLRRFVYSTTGGVVAALTLFRSPTTRWSAIAFGVGVGLGSAFIDSSYILNNSRPTRPYNTR